jgi:hypothetical protein
MQIVDSGYPRKEGAAREKADIIVPRSIGIIRHAM